MGGNSRRRTTLSDNRKSLEEAAVIFGEAFPSLISHLFVTYLLWIFAVFIFFPISLIVSGSITSLVGLFFLVAILASAIRAALAGRKAVEGLATLASSRKRGRQALETALKVRNLGYIVLSMALAVVFIPVLGMINIVLAGISLAATVVLIFMLGLPLLVRGLESFVRRL